MAQGKIVVETSRLDSTAAQVERLADQYQSEYGSLFGTVRDLQDVYKRQMPGCVGRSFCSLCGSSPPAQRTP